MKLPAIRGKIRKKYALRLMFGPVIARVLHAFGLSWQRIGKFLGREALIAQVKELEKSVQPASHRSPMKIAFLSVGGNYGFYIDVLLALALKDRGHHPFIVLNDQSLPIDEGSSRDHPEGWDRSARNAYAYSKRFLESLHLDVITYSEMVGQAGVVPAELNFLMVEEASLLRHYRVGQLSESLPDLEIRKNKVRKAIEVVSKIGVRLHEIGADCVLMNHGLYSSTGPAREVLNHFDVPVLSYDRAKKKECLTFSWGRSSDQVNVDDLWETARNRPLSAKEEIALDSYIKARITHENDRFIYNFGEKQSKKQTMERFRLDPEKPVYTLFTNVLWDAACAQREATFRNSIELVIETIRWFEKRPEKQLIVKIHPAEVVIGTRQPFIEMIKEAFPKIPDNIRVIEPHEKVNSWSIYDVTQLGIVHTTTVGMEMPLLGIPCVVTSLTHYRGKGFTIDANSVDHYFQILENYTEYSVEKDRMVLLARRYMNIAFMKYFVRFPYLFELSETDVRAFTFSKGLRISKHEHMKMIIEGIEMRKSICMQ